MWDFIFFELSRVELSVCLQHHKNSHKNGILKNVSNANNKTYLVNKVFLGKDIY